MAGTTSAGPAPGTSGGDGGVKDQAQEKAHQVREQAGEQVRQATGQARDRVREQVDQRSTQAGEQVQQHAGDLRDVAHQLRQQGKDGPARIADQVAERAERAGSWMKDSDGDRILGDIEDAARNNPWAVVAGGLALGFAASRLLKASSSRRYEQRDTTPRLPAAGGTTAHAPDGPVAGGLTTVGIVDEPRTIPADPRPIPADPAPAARPASPAPGLAPDDDRRTIPARGGGL